ncbi:MAG: L,D-transpeptidase [Actinomycetota bacterium]|nr:L,D-transpeptidase [Actinomycetota bacterium]
MRRASLLLAGLVVLVAGACGPGLVSTPQALPPVPTTTTLPPTTTPPDLAPLPSGRSYVAAPMSAPLSYSASPGGPVIGQLDDKSWGAPTVGPVLAARDGWLQIRLHTRPNGSTAWVPRQAVTLASTPYQVVVSISRRTLTLYLDGQPTYRSDVGVGKPQWSTPVGPTFVVAIDAVPNNQQYIYGPIVVVLASHSDVFTEFDGGDGTVAIHGYPSDPASTRGVASSHGCVRASPETMNALTNLPLGTPVDIVA